ncbi:hypothetical protein [Myxococcus stipitatus]|uniref:hypothetical protein n=1 Tax=Myxococcus stipitatus TaxID=83455 RepID=UPI0030CAF23B
MKGGLVQHARHLLALARKELEVHARLDRDVRATLLRLEARSPEFARARAQAHACAVFPSLSQGSAVLGGTWGLGEVFVRGRRVGYSALAQLTVGVQLGGQTSSEVILFADEASFERLKQRGTGLALEAAVTLVKAGVAWARSPQGTTHVVLTPRGGLWVGAGLGVRRFFFAPAVLTRGAALHRVSPSLDFSRERASASKSNETGERAMVKAQTSSTGHKGPRTLLAWGRRSLKPGPRKVTERARDAVQRAGTRGRETLAHLREHTPSGGQLRARAAQARTWTADQLEAHGLAIGLATLAAGVAGAALLPVSEREKHALSTATGKVRAMSRHLRERSRMTRVARSARGEVTRGRGAAASSARGLEAGAGHGKSTALRGKKTRSKPAAARLARPATKRAKPPAAKQAGSKSTGAGQTGRKRSSSPQRSGARNKPS